MHRAPQPMLLSSFFKALQSIRYHQCSLPDTVIQETRYTDRHTIQYNTTEEFNVTKKLSVVSLIQHK